MWSLVHSRWIVGEGSKGQVAHRIAQRYGLAAEQLATLGDMPGDCRDHQEAP